LAVLFSADAVCNLSGFGFSGYDDRGNAKWELCTNVRPYQVEVFSNSHDSLSVLTPVVVVLRLISLGQMLRKFLSSLTRWRPCVPGHTFLARWVSILFVRCSYNFFMFSCIS
uniref:CUB domain-containing protein n=1 Tax=Haemonchus placei TaxID=6290 RepID=A0A0N4VRV8_HAEPC